MERIAGNALNIAGATSLAEVHLERARRTFDLIGHSIGSERVQRREDMPADLPPANHGTLSTACLDRVRVLLDLRARPELFAQDIGIAGQAPVFLASSTRAMPCRSATRASEARRAGWPAK